MPDKKFFPLQSDDEIVFDKKNTFLFDLINHPVIVRDKNDTIKYCNPAFEKLFEYSSKEIINKLKFGFFVLKYYDYSYFENSHSNKNDHNLNFFATLKTTRLAKIKNFILLSNNLPDKSVLTFLLDHSEKLEYLQELFKQNTHIHQAFHSIPDIIFIFNKNYIVKEINYKEGSYLLKPREELLNSSIDELPLDDSLIVRTKMYLDQVFNTGKPIEYEYSLGETDDEHFFECRMVPGDDQVIAIIRDITENKTREKEIKEKEKKYKNLLEDIPQAVLEVNYKGEILYKNQRYIDFLFRAGVSNRNNFKDILGEEVFELLLYNYSNKVSAPCIFPFGKYFIEFHISESKNRKDIKSYIILLNDVSENEINKRALQESKNNYETLVETSPSGIIIRDFDNIYYANRMALDIFNVKNHNELDFSKYFSVNDLMTFRGRLSAVKNGIDVSYKEFKMIHPDRKDVIIETKPVYIQYKGKPAFQIVFRDVSLQKKLQQERFEKQLMVETNRNLRAEIDNRLIIEDELRNSLDQNTILLKEIHHRIKNNFQVISSLINFTSKNFSDPLLNQSFADINSRIKSMAIVHDFFYKSEDFSSVLIGEYLHKIHRDYLRENGMNGEKEAVKFQSDMTEICIGVDDAITIGLIFSELLVICKYLHDNFTNKYCNFVELKRINSQKLELCLASNNEKKTKNENLINESDLSLLEVLINQMNGEIVKNDLTCELRLKLELTKKL
ncbi:MAG: hypothetical protein C0592_11430 [Marinilabiliales bacterium]|nr:MAG: hypothetical protein C0592_11430 [Marinilabiliales bacterium]